MSGRKKIMARANEEQLLNRKRLMKLWETCPIPNEELILNLGLYTRSSVFAKILYLNELYQLILDKPGIIMEFGAWWGQNLVWYESLRAAYEPYNFTRKIVGFDTFKGYPSISVEDGDDDLVKVGGYSVTEGYERHLEELLDYHEKENVMSQIKKIELVKGDITETLEKYLKDHPETIISLVYFDLQLYEPTKKCLELIKPYVIKGSIIAMDEINCSEFPGETIAFKEAWGLTTSKIYRSKFLPDRSYVIVS